MYLATIIVTMVLMPIASIALEAAAAGSGAALLPLVGKWFVFWGAGIRLMLAGIIQAFRPSFTAEKIFHIRDPEAAKIVLELGFANFSIGLLCALSLAFPHWLLPAAVSSALFFFLAGVQHLRNTARSRKENIALVSDLLIAAVLAAYIAGTVA